MIKEDGSVIHFNNPKVQASLAANTFAVTGHAETKQITEMLPGILNQLGAESLTHLKRLASVQSAMGAYSASTLVLPRCCGKHNGKPSRLGIFPPHQNVQWLAWCEEHRTSLVRDFSCSEGRKALVGECPQCCCGPRSETVWLYYKWVKCLGGLSWKCLLLQAWAVQKVSSQGRMGPVSVTAIRAVCHLGILHGEVLR